MWKFFKRQYLAILDTILLCHLSYCKKLISFSNIILLVCDQERKYNEAIQYTEGLYMTFQRITEVILNRRRELLLVALMNTIYAFSFFQRVAIPGTIYNELQTAFNLSAVQVSMLGGIYLYIYGGMQMFSGMLVDRFGPVRIILTGGGILAAGSILFPLSSSVTSIYISRAIVGLGASLIYLCVLKELDISFDNRYFTILLSSSLFAGYLGGLLGTAPFESAVRMFGWKISLVCIGIASVIAVALVALMARGHYDTVSSCNTGKIMPAMRSVIRNTPVYWAIFPLTVVFSNYFIMQAIIGKKLFEDIHRISASNAALLVFTMTMVCMVSTMFSGFILKIIGDRRKPFLVTSCVLSVIASCMLLLVLYCGKGWILPCILILGISYAGNPIFTSVIKELSNPDYAASAAGIANAAAYFMIGVYATAAGVVLDRFSSDTVRTATGLRYPAHAYMVICIGMIIFGILGLVSSLFIRETFGRNIWITMERRDDVCHQKELNLKK